jgi:tetratricopeptide (TPR) repeat protein
MGLLADYGLVERVQVSTATSKTKATRTFSMHPVVHTWAMRMQNQSERVASLNVALSLFAAMNKSTVQGWAHFDGWIPHANSVLRWTTEIMSSTDGDGLTKATLSHRESIKGLYRIAGIFKRARRYQKCGEVFAVLEKHANPDTIHLENKDDAAYLARMRVDTLRLHGRILWHNQTDAARLKLQEALDLALRLDPPVLQDFTWDAWNSLGKFYTSKHFLDEAEECLSGLQKTLDAVPLERRRRSYDAARARLALHVGKCARRRGQYGAAQRELESGIATAAKIGNGMSMSTQHLLMEQGTLFHKMGRYEAAEENLRSCFMEMLRHLGPKHPTTLLASRKLINVLRHQGKTQDAKEIRALVNTTSSAAMAHRSDDEE